MTWLLDLIPGGSLAKTIAGAVAGFVAAIAIFAVWNAFIENPRLKYEVRVATEARMSNQFFKTVGEMTDAAEAARIRARLCTQSGGLYDFETGDCRER